ncbi:ficolin-2-like isoform X1 [Lucilia cuprina]|uniref:ficolin-2-like isoform X1 n=1 Tax=Lucilia cuprina TaxID=7375 RepID=UPI001F06A585|nr:ficolin-2-like isoform X1 [Lucilia cuprina]
MQLFAKIFLIVFVLQNVNCEFEICNNENKECQANEIMFSDAASTDLNTLVKHAIQYFSELNKKYDKKINSISSDINHVKKTLMVGEGSTNCLQPPEQQTDIETTTENHLYKNLWVIIQRRQDGSINFYRSWDHYKHGFGNPFREFFIGLDNIHYLTNSGPHELLIQLKDFKGNLRYALYDEFLVGDESEKYQLKKLGSYSGNASDHLRSHVGMYFSTKDRDNDASTNLHCAKSFQGGWWYNNCLTSNLNGPFRTRYVISNIGITWGKFDELRLQTVQMMVRLKS